MITRPKWESWSRAYLKWLLSAVLVTLTLFGGLVWHVFNTFQVGRDVKEEYVRAEELRDEICLLHQRLGTVAAMVVASDETRWRTRHADLKGQLSRLLGETLVHEVAGYNLEAFSQAQRSHGELRRIEKRAFALTGEGQMSPALDLISGNDYQGAQTEFSQAAGRFVGDYRNFLNARLLRERNKEVYSLVIAFIIFVITLSVWAGLLYRLENSRRQLRSLAAHLQSAREEERSGIAREIHDEMGQALAVLKMGLFRLKERLSGRDDDLQAATQTMLGSVDSTIGAVQRIMSELHPPILDDLGLAAAVEWQLEQFQERSGIDCSCECGIQKSEFSSEESLALFRILQESLTNVIRHADATRVRVQLKPKLNWLILRVSDNGRGVSTSDLENPRSFGLIGIRERAHMLGGKARIRGSQGKGTTVSVWVPFHRRAAH